MTFLTLVVTAAHVFAAAVWFGAMAYSLAVVQPRVERVLGGRAEELLVILGSGARWKVVGLIGVLAASGVGLVLLAPGDGALWWASVVASAVALVAATAVFCVVSWRMWPARVFALPGELPAHRRRFRLVAWTMLTLTGAATAFGVLAHVSR
ncbi:MAG: hypothetical protein GEV10_12910 [Streptosporangiales bacterium]|nr:hypothetical protein [Streptosporangiales bacterium]